MSGSWRDSHSQHFTKHLHFLLLTHLLIVHALGYLPQLLPRLLCGLFGMMFVTFHFIVLNLELN